MDYLDIDTFMHTLICFLAVMLGIGLALLCILYEENIRLTQVVNSSGGGKVAYVFPQDRWFNISS